MPNSIFGTPSHLLAELASGSTPTGNGPVHMPTSVHQPPPSFPVQFGTIGKPPNLLSRISAPDPMGQISFRSPSPGMSPLPPPVTTGAPVQNSRKLAERIQMGPSQLNSSAQSPGLHPVREPRINHNCHIAANSPVSSDNLIPPIAVIIPVASESNKSLSEQMQARANGIPIANKVRKALTPELVYPAPSPTTPTIRQSNHNISLSNPSGSPKPNFSVGLFPQFPPTQSLFSSTLLASHSPNFPPAGLSSSQVLDVAPPEGSQQQVVQESLSDLYNRLHAQSSALASLAPPTLPSRTPSPFATPLNISQLAAGLHSEMNTEEPGTIVLRHPYPQSGSTSNGTLDQELLPSGDSNALALTSSQASNLPTSRSTHLVSLVEAAKQFQAAAGAAVKLQLDADRAFQAERMEFDERRKVFEERMLAREAEHQAQMQVAQKQLEELRAREEKLVALEEESRLRDETRRAQDAQRRARDYQRKLEDESRRTAIQEEITETMKLLEQAKAEMKHWQKERERAERDKTPAQNNAPPLQFSVGAWPCVEKEDGMTEEEIEMVANYKRTSEYLKSANDWVDRSLSALQRMKETRLQAAAAEHRRIAEEAERQIVQAEEAAKRAGEEQEQQRREQALDTRQGQQPPVAVGGEHLSHAALLAQQSAHAEAQLQNTQIDTQAEYNRLRAEVLAKKQQTTSENATRIHAERAGHPAISTTDGDGPDDMLVEMEVDELASPVEHTVPLLGQGASHTKSTSRTKKTARPQGTSGNVMFGTPSTTTSRLSDGPLSSLMSTPVTSSAVPTSYKTPSFVSASTEVGRQVITDAPLYPTQLASELHMSPSPSSNVRLPTFKQIPFPTTPKSRTIIRSEGNDWAEWPIGPEADLSPAQRDANLRHIKKNRHRVEENATGDRSVKQPDESLPAKAIKTEEMVVGELHDQEQTSNVPQGGVFAQTTDTMVPIQNDSPPPTQAISNTNDSQPNDIPQTFAELITSQLPNTSARAGTQVDSVGGSGPVPMPVPRVTKTRSPDPWVMDASVDRQEWTADPASPRSGPLEFAHGYDPEQHSRQNSQISRRTRSPEPPVSARSNGTNGGSRVDHGQRQQSGPRYPDHYSPPPASATSSHSRHLEQNVVVADFHSGLPPPRPLSPMNGDRKRPAERNNEDDNRYRRRPRSDLYESERDRGYRNPREVVPTRRSPTPEWHRGRSTSPSEFRGSTYIRLRSPSPSRQVRSQRDTLDRRGGQNESSYTPDYTNTVDPIRRPSDAKYSMEERPCDVRDGQPSLLGRLSSPGHRGNPVRGKGRVRGDAGRGRGGGGGRGRTQPPYPYRTLEERLE
ncbi:uncharacterized protein EDB91DRAFT_1105226 [Suillus paluster]|uniref:uncharacterized protein n=1 Tax=Suillus paluster TaxID=48578 RepID=UPI001B86322A|nr:uncharacterized protein EDB91DRAFT_1105226 [Suillus paluster]KAG1751391.1 hypothetical protein EDB91DRAFT_1105226 [Suillus paluster]